MPEADDFDLVVDDEYARPRRGSSGLWLAVAGIALVFLVLVYVSYRVMSGRLEEEPVDGPPPGVVVTPTEFGVGAVVLPTETEAVALNPTGTTTPTPEPTTTPSPTDSPSPTGAPECGIPAADEFATIYSRDLLGCPRAEFRVIWAAWEGFERGAMLWRGDTDRAYVFIDSGEWSPIDERWDGSAVADRGDPPPGLLAPERGFGYVWGASDALFQSLGWATTEERGFCAEVQEFEEGFILRSIAVPSCTPDNLYNHAAGGDWSPLFIYAANRGWVNLAANLSTPEILQTPSPLTGEMRPAGNGVFYADYAEGIILDGDLREWSGNWIPLQTVVYGAENHAGPGDISGNFLLGWNEQGIWIGLRVNDDIYRAGPPGTNMWQGDGIELHFDRALMEDYADAQANGDDYQIGFSFGPEGDGVLAYRWLPLAEEGDIDVAGGLLPQGAGYDIELLVPWQTFGLSSGSVIEGMTFGFNLSLNDNDDDTPAQQTVVSASPQRTTHDDPTEWGTLILRR